MTELSKKIIGGQFLEQSDVPVGMPKRFGQTACRRNALHVGRLVRSRHYQSDSPAYVVDR